MAFIIKAYHPSCVIKFVEASQAGRDHRVSSRPPVLPTPCLLLYNKKPFLGICLKNAKTFRGVCGVQELFFRLFLLLIISLTAGVSRYTWTSPSTSGCNRSIASTTNPIMPWVDFASPLSRLFLFYLQTIRGRRDAKQIWSKSISFQ